VTLTWDNWKLMVDDEAVSDNLPGVKDVLARMAAHGVREIVFSAGIEPGQVLGAIWILAKEPVLGDGGSNALARLAKLGTTGVRFVPVSAHSAPPVPREPAPTPATSELAMSLDFDLQEPEPEPPRRDSGAHVVPAATRATGGMFQQFSPTAADTPETLVARLQSLTNLDQLSRTLEAISNLIDSARSSQRIGDAADLVTAVMASESRFTEPEAKRTFSIIVRRMVTHSLLLAFAADLPRARPRNDQYMALFARFGDDGVDALIEQLAYAEVARERRVLFNAIVELRRGVPTLIRMLSDPRWYVARNAAELLGEMHAAEGEAALIQCLRHDDARVRRSSAAALAKLGTSSAMAALTEAMRDASPNVRMVAALAIAMRKDPRATSIFLRALADEQDAEVQRTLFVALGRLATPEAVRRLIAEAEPDTRLFRKKPVTARLAAVQGLSEARTPDAIAALEALTNDRERDVREAAAKAIAAGAPPTARPQNGW
jgi:HEAT repeat protein